MLKIQPSEGSMLSHLDSTRCLAPIPFGERDLPTATAEPYFKVGDSSVALEGPAFDRNGNLLFVDVYGGRVLRLSPGRELTTLYVEKDLHPAGIAIHKDGRIFVACVGPINSAGQFDAGSVIALDADGSNRQTIVSPDAGYVIDDMVFDREGGFYFTDFRGSTTEAVGGLFYVAPDHRTISPVLPGMCAANGVALSPDDKVVWATEYCVNRLHRVELASPGVRARGGVSVPYTFAGRAPDSMRTDADGNVYVALNWQGRVMVHSPFGIPIGQILLPGREENKYLKSTSLALVPGSRDLVIVARDVVRGEGAMIFTARGMAPGFPMFSHQ
ncbi:SMP-30/gluconolactonase/LRE family protein [Cupriavidus alkaliphilus]|uniref:SMP-30/gluconolactonase/LRE family protein n=1 Tax=Cupriavidus alkaliphilus TaxID=942866 RepID=UPI001856B9BD|nr:SMP-30/gluconolactonase/LRE family protein [Cupriavidus alkaliphilus]MBB3014046.1 lactonase [Cupriavidus alkaliphilus]